MVSETVYRWIERKGLPAQKVGKLWKPKLSEVDEWVRAGGAAKPIGSLEVHHESERGLCSVLLLSRASQRDVCGREAIARLTLVVMEEAPKGLRCHESRADVQRGAG